MVEIGKKDILDRNTLSMETFNRNASFRALDLSHEQVSDGMVARYVSPQITYRYIAYVKNSLLSEVFQLLDKGHIKPISPIQTFPFTGIPAALRMMRSGKHIGKLVISRIQDLPMHVPVSTAPRDLCLRRDACYLIVGGLRGLCSSLAIYLAKNGAKYMAVMSRSGHDDEISQRAVHDIQALGCTIDLICGDVTSIEDVRRAFRDASAPIAGVIQGSMVLCVSFSNTIIISLEHSVGHRS